jgi:hypothetical protein
LTKEKRKQGKRRREKGKGKGEMIKESIEKQHSRQMHTSQKYEAITRKQSTASIFVRGIIKSST